MEKTLSSVLPFPSRKPARTDREVDPERAALNQGVPTIDSVEQEIRAIKFTEIGQLRGKALAQGYAALEMLQKFRADLKWTSEFCAQCAAASELDDLDQLILKRDELARVLRKRWSNEGDPTET